MFLSETNDLRDEREGRSMSCPNSVRFTYGFVILFNWDEQIKKPFKIFPRKAFSTEEISDRCYTSRVSDEYRVKKLKRLRPLPGNKLSIFCKVEDGKYHLFIYVIENLNMQFYIYLKTLTFYFFF